MPRPRGLLVDDDANPLGSMRRRLAPKSAVATALSGQEALEPMPQAGPSHHFEPFEAAGARFCPPPMREGPPPRQRRASRATQTRFDRTRPGG
jgi:hypothetical protein